MPFVKNAIRSVPRSLSKAEQRKILAVTGEHVDGFRDHMIVSLALGTGLREGELAALDVGDVAINSKTIRSRVQLRSFARKGLKAGSLKGPPGKVSEKRESDQAKAQRVFVPKLARRKLLKFIAWKKKVGELIGPDNPLFVSSRGDRIAVRTMRHLWRTWQKRAGFEHFYTFHELRHTALTNLYGATKDLVLVQRQARHASVTTTQIYAHVSDEDLQKAVDGMQS